MKTKNIQIHFQKAFQQFSLSFTNAKNYSEQHFISNSDSLKLQIHGLLDKLITSFNEQTNSLKRQVKIKRKENQRLVESNRQKKHEWELQKKKLENQIQRNKTKISQLLKELYKKEIFEGQSKTNISTDQEVQCQLQFLEFAQTLEIYQKQNISLSKIIVQLKQIIIQKQSQLQAQKILICQLIEELQYQKNQQIVNVSIDNVKRSTLSFSQQSEELMQQCKDSSSLEQAEQSSEKEDEDNSTIADASDFGDKDFELPEWMQFDESLEDSNGIEIVYQHENQEHQTWFQILIQKFCNKFKWNNFLM